MLREDEEVFMHGGPSKAEQGLKHENQRLKDMIGELTVEPKETAYDESLP